MTGTEDGEIKLWDLASGQELHLLQSNELGYYYMSIDHLPFSPDGDRIISSSDDRSIKLWDASSGQLLRTFDDQPGTMIQKSRILGVGFSPDGKRLLSVTTSPDDKIRTWEVETGKLLSDLKLTHPENWTETYTSLEFRPSMDSFVASSDFGGHLYDVTTAKPILAIEGLAQSSMKVAVSADGRKAMMAHSNSLSMVELPTGKQLHRIEPTKNDGFSSSAVYSPNGKNIRNRRLSRITHNLGHSHRPATNPQL